VCLPRVGELLVTMSIIVGPLPGPRAQTLERVDSGRRDTRHDDHRRSLALGIVNSVEQMLDTAGPADGWRVDVDDA
jgi:hypothetical protein